MPCRGGEPDFAYWTDDAKIPAKYPARPHFLAPSTKELAAVKDRIHFYIDNEKFYIDNEEILPGVTVLSAPGHTVSHSIFMLNSGGKQLCYIGDLLLLEHPRTQFAYDTDPVASAESRVRMLTMRTANRTPLLAYFPLPMQQETIESL